MNQLKKFNILMYVVSGALLAFAMNYPQSLSFFSFFFLAPILLSLKFESKTNISFKDGFLRMFLFSGIFIAGSTLWFLSAYPLDWLSISDPSLGFLIIFFTWFFFILFFSIPVAFFVKLIQKFYSDVPVYAAVLGASVWVTLEYIRSWVIALGVYGEGTLFGPHHTYYSLGYLVAEMPLLRDLLPVGGIYLASFVIVMVNYFFYFLISYFFDRKFDRRVLPLLFLISGILLYSYFYMSKVRSVAVPSEEFNASVASTALASSLDAAGRLEKSKIAVNLVSSVSDPKSVIILPENFDVVTPFYKDKNLHKGFSETGHLVIGSYTGERFYNMYFLEASKNRLEFYKKQLLMPLGEYNIYIISTILKILNNEDWLESYNKVSHRASKSSGLLNYNDVGNSGAVFGASVCSENISPYIYRDATKFGATVLVNIASHAPFHGSVLLARQTISISKARALENGRYFIVASNFSNSFVISDRGDLVIISDDSHKSYFLNSKIKIKKYITPYVYFGDYVAIISFSVLIIFLIWKKKE